MAQFTLPGVVGQLARMLGHHPKPEAGVSTEPKAPSRPALTFLIEDGQGVSFQTTSMQVYSRLQEHGPGALTPTATHESVDARAHEKGWRIIAETTDPEVGYDWLERHGVFGPGIE